MIDGEGTSQQDVIDASDCVAPAIEILDTIIQRVDPETGKTYGIFDTVGDNAASAGIVHFVILVNFERGVILSSHTILDHESLHSRRLASGGWTTEAVSQLVF